MNIEQMKAVLKEIITNTDLTPCVVGHRGVGKSAGINQVCKEAGFKYVSLRLGQMEVGDLVGIPYREGEVMHWSRPAWWPAEDDLPTVVHCDELNRAQQEDTLQAIFQFVEPPVTGENRALHTHKLGKQHKVIVTINPPDGTYHVTPLDRALVDRMIMLYVETDFNCWARYAEGQDFNLGVRDFLSANQELLSKHNNPMQMEAEPTERGWEMVSILASSCRFPKELEVEVYAGVIGQEAAIAFLRWQNDLKGRPLTASDIIDNWAENKEKAIKQRDDQQGATISSLYAALKNSPNLDSNQKKNLLGYIEILPKDLRFAVIKNLLTIPEIAMFLASEENDSVVMDAIKHITEE
ncbi:MAG: hypothetical protein FWD70_04075, partial [Desulfuromonadales bacterium]|nr:hypothetical protein [Desulfuromonadales bacterium]